jgi:hypothetical protein
MNRVGLTPAIEGESANLADGALRKLFFATCELLKMYIPKVGVSGYSLLAFRTH